MAKETTDCLKNQTIYCVYVRNHTKEGTFLSLKNDLKRIRNLGVDIIWLMPIHPIGKENRKGSLGSPYSIQNYMDVNPEFGTLKDFKMLLEEVHQLGMKLMLDVVFNHTSRDSVYMKKHPEFFIKSSEGMPCNRCDDWVDVYDLDYENKDLWNEQLKVLKYWAKMGVDGYRCDVASLVPIEFWVKARAEVAKINAQFIWLAESIHTHFITHYRERGYLAQSDSEMYQAFDITYDYDAHAYFTNYFDGKEPLKSYIEFKKLQEAIYPANFIKLRFLENHDQKRAHSLIPNKEELKNWMAFSFFEKGTALLYAGQETLSTHTPSLFEKEDVHFAVEDDDFLRFVKRVVSLKKDPEIMGGVYTLLGEIGEGVVEAIYRTVKRKNVQRVTVGIFNLKAQSGNTQLQVIKQNLLSTPRALEGFFTNLLNDQEIEIRDGGVQLRDCPMVIQVDEEPI